MDVEGVKSRRPGVVALAGRRDELAHGVCPTECTDIEIQASTNAATKEAWHPFLISFAFLALGGVLRRREQVDWADQSSGNDSWIR